MPRNRLAKATIDLRKYPWMRKIIPAAEPELKTGPEGRTIFVSSPYLAGNERKYLMECIDTNWISSKGKFIDLFEKEFAKKIGVQHAVSCTSGTAALHLTLTTLGLNQSTEVIMPAFTMIATANTASHTGAKIRLVDSDAKTWNLRLDDIESKMNAKTRAIIAVHTYGAPVNMDVLTRIAGKHKLYLIEDAAEAHGAVYRNRRVGSFGTAGCFSFYANKIITTGEGGMVTTNDSKLAAVIRNIRDHAFSPARHFWHSYLGFNYRMTNMQAAIGYAQTQNFEELVRARMKNAEHYTDRLKKLPGIGFSPQISHAKNVSWMYCLTIEPEFGMDRDQLRFYLAERGIETRTFFIPIHLQPIYFREFEGQRFPVAEELCRKGLYLPSSAGLSEQDIDYICDAVVSANRSVRRKAAR